MNIDNSPITQHCYAGHTFYLKRDDLLHSHFTGNKARKFMQLLCMDLPHVNTLISYGSAQANSLYSLAALARIKKWQLEFYVDHLPEWLIERPQGNYRGALELGAKIIEVSKLAPTFHPRDYIDHVRKPDPHCYVVPEGGRFALAEEGIKQLALELLAWSRFEPKQQFAVALPSGTGTTALYLHKYLKPHNIDVVTCACVGGDEYLTSQFAELGEPDHPTILTPTNKHHFGKLYQADYEIWQSLLKQTDIEFDLLYDPLMWRCLLPWLEQHPDKTLLYVHQGGLLGNESMLPRYQRKFPPNGN
ncbi:1-aminocyclopropane-1-carboxylate deaminase/D-cysteine desulfhydrase [Vibrio sp. IRLE0018]|uniref:1-aminocyclopropane-1-carboxylate deaminase/D-cysteine desulfhydrase n=1 Tax=Vibrio TaxID=662 RepID=UPI001593DB9B|nr:MULTISPECIES: 1-aminocyclopropane-1-carboxylate deaminase/D-cysteine desulfhydrase [Vibrio]MCF8779047.1 1-aminocyclopropane-1-carboxylate deaminase/D-cysteine desulfhydrase [Vibrio floridensis]NVC61804.1 1-aminocyclopropane-1-carboxylate deaminase/D-cysteine desulfhydrase [Vibrio sp. 05-20-BW147]HAS6347695.1 pyridoxal-phosphate dependent enzyme [Vibrio vulnificus]HAS6350492.1 pyridoxal-phosphate dependent enzyme [Vibrio vulnificus]